MRPIPKPLLREMLDDSWYEFCCYPDCHRQAELEHVWKYSGRQINEKWAIIPVCPYHHRLSGTMNKEFHEYLSIIRATEDDFKKYPRINWAQRKSYLVAKYGRNASTNSG